MGRDILIVDDEVDILNILKYNLEKADFNVICARNGNECLNILETKHPDLIILDLMMPDISGVKICKMLKKSPNKKDIPIIMLTARSTEHDIIKGLNYGADDYITKPFSIDILLARINAVLRRKTKENGSADILKIENLVMNFKTREVYLDDKKIELTYSRFEILALMLKNPNIVLSRKDIIKAVKGEDYPVTERAIDVHIVDLRKSLGKIGDCIKTVRGIGYKFEYKE